MIPVIKTALDRGMVAPVRKSDRACPAQAQQTASAFKHFRQINRSWQPSTAALMQYPRAKLRRKNVKKNSGKENVPVAATDRPVRIQRQGGQVGHPFACRSWPL